MNWLHTIYFHIWHFQYQQQQLTNWFGNIEADVVGLLISAVIWKLFLRNIIQKFLTKAHKTALDIHFERTQKAEKKRHRELIAQNEKHHQERLIQQEDHNRRITDHITKKLDEHHEKLKQYITNTLNSDGSQTSK
jgi:flagellar biosynthesis/type III secretory pathway M-ring protein FliF/YscJ